MLLSMIDFDLSEDKGENKQEVNFVDSYQQTVKSTTKEKSPYTAQYLQYFDYADLEQYQRKQQTTLNNLKNREGIYIKDEFSSKFEIQIIGHSPNYEFIEIEATLGWFNVKNITIANFNQKSRSNLVTQSYSGNFCTVYIAKCFGQKFAIKAFPLNDKQKYANGVNPKNQKPKIIRSAIKEYCLTLICSYLKIGPKVQKILGYDIAVYEDSIEFPMEFCIQIKKYSSPILQKELKETLRTAHLYRLIHYDIKPDNICFSKLQNRIVFIDFGFSEFVDTKLGVSEPVKFKGSLTFASKQMIHNFYNEVPCYLDPYFNDMHCLQKSIQYIQNQQNEQRIDYKRIRNLVTDDSNLTRFHLLKYVKYHLFNLDNQRVKHLLINKDYQQVLDEERDKIRQFIATLNYPSRFVNFQPKKYQDYQEHFPNHYSIGYKKFFDEQPEMATFQNNIDKEILYKQTFDILEEISSLNSTSQSQSQQQNLLSISSAKKNICRQTYFSILAQALQINSNKYTLSVKQKIAKAAYEFINQSKSKVKTMDYQKRQVDLNDRVFYIKEVSKQLLKYSLTPPYFLKKLKIFLSTLTNIIILDVLPQEKIFQYYKRIHSLQINIQLKMKMVFVFVTRYEWKRWKMKSYDNYFKHLHKYKEFSRAFIKQMQRMGYDQKMIQIYELFTQTEKKHISLRLSNVSAFQQYQRFQVNLDTLNDLKFKKLILEWYNYRKNVILHNFPSANAFYEKKLYKQMYHLNQIFEYDYFGLYRYYVSEGYFSRTIQMLSHLFSKILGQTQVYKEYVMVNLTSILKNIEQINACQEQISLQSLSEMLPQQFQEQQIIRYFIHYDLQKYKGSNKLSRLVYSYLESPLFNNFQTKFQSLEDFYNKRYFNEKKLVSAYLMVNLLTSEERSTLDHHKLLSVIKSTIKAQKTYLVNQQVKKNHEKVQEKLRTLMQLIYFLFFKRQFKELKRLCSIVLRLSYILRKTLFQKYATNLMFFSTCLKQVCPNFIISLTKDDILIYNHFLQGPNNFDLLLKQRLFVNFLAVARRYLEPQVYIDFYIFNIKSVLPAYAQSKDKTFIFMLSMISRDIFQRQSKEGKAQFLHRIFLNITQSPELSLIAINFLNEPSMRQNSTHYLKVFKTLQYLPATYANICFNATIKEYMLAYTPKLAYRKRHYLRKRSIKTYSICDAAQNLRYYDYYKSKFDKYIGKYWKSGQRGFVQAMLTCISRIKTYDFILKI